MSQDPLRQWLEFYRDLGIRELHRVEPRAAELNAPAEAPVMEAAPVVPPSVVPAFEPLPEPVAKVSDLAEPKSLPKPVKQPRPAIEIPQLIPLELPPLAPPDDTLEKIRADIGDCRRCRLCEARNRIVFGSGNEQAGLVFVGEGPGADEDASGLPFVGRAGQLLTQMIDGTSSREGLTIRRPDVYIANVVKCRPPENRTPQPDEMEICGQFLYRQLQVIKPKAIVALGSTAAKALLNTKEGVTKLRGNWRQWHGIPVMTTYHPSYLLRPYNQNAKREAWEDLKQALHFAYD